VKVKMNKDPLSIIISLIYNLNLLEESREFNINELKSLPQMDRHWITIKKYLKIIQLIQKYCPQIELKDSKFVIKKSQVYQRFNKKEQLLLFLFNNQALDEENAIDIPDRLDNPSIRDSLGFLFHKTVNGKYYLSKSGIEGYKSINSDLNDLIYNNKNTNEVFPKKERYEEVADTSEHEVKNIPANVYIPSDYKIYSDSSPKTSEDTYLKKIIKQSSDTSKEIKINKIQ